MRYVLGIIVFIIAVTIFGYIMKNKKYRQLDQLEAWKIDLMNQPVPAELSKVKQLNMTGQTEQMFDKWRKSWDEIVTFYLPEVEELLFDAEDYADKYQFKKTRSIQDEINKKLLFVENQIERIIQGLGDLLGNEEKNKKDTEEARGKYRELKRELLTNRHAYGKAEVRLEVLLDEIDLQFVAFEEATENGNVMEAREIVIQLVEQLNSIEKKLGHIPHLLISFQQELPAKLTDLSNGYKEMVAQGFELGHLQIEKETSRLKKQAQTYANYLYKSEIDEALAGEAEMVEQVELLYDLLEKEALAKKFVHQQKGQTDERLALLQSEGKRIEKETDFVKQNYHIQPAELELFSQLNKKLEAIDQKMLALTRRISENTTAYSVVKADLESLSDELEIIRQEQSKYAEKLHMLRKDEMEAKESLQDIRQKLTEIKRTISKSNLPGLPEEFQYFLEDTHRSIAEVIRHLEQKPLDVPTVQKSLEQANAMIEKLSITATDMLETVQLAELVIQYGNRYRSQSMELSSQLESAEKSFRMYQYKTALEEAASAVEAVEPGAIKKLENMLNNQE